MTTVYVNVIKGIIYTDSRCTTTTIVANFSQIFTKKRAPKILSFTQVKKTWIVNKCAIVATGDVEVSRHFKELFELNKNPSNFPLPKHLHKTSGSILVVRPGYVIYFSTNKDGKVHRKTIMSDSLTAGSGAACKILSHAQGYLWNLTKEEIEKVLRLNSLFDIYSDDKIAIMTPEEYRGLQ